MDKLGVLVHTVGLSCLFGAVLLEVLTFWGIAMEGFFLAVEGNSLILGFEVGLTVCGVCYLVFLWLRFLHSIKHRK